VIDVRRQDEWDEGHLGCANLVPSLTMTQTQIDELTGGMLGMKILLYCRSGARADYAKGMIESWGYTNVINMMGYDDVVAKGCSCDKQTDMSMDGHENDASHEMTFGCGNTECLSSQSFIQSNIDMHDKMALHFTCDPEIDFVRSMIPHHNGGIAMCFDVRTHEFILDWNIDHVCNHVESDQTQEVIRMEQWLELKGVDAGDVCNDGSMGCGNLDCKTSQDFLEINHRMHQNMAINFTCDPQLDFALGMIPHHQGAIDMCGALTSYYEDAQVESPSEFLLGLCSNITASQDKEIIEMILWMSMAHPGSTPANYECQDTQTHHMGDMNGDMDMGDIGMNSDMDSDTDMNGDMGDSQMDGEMSETTDATTESTAQVTKNLDANPESTQESSTSDSIEQDLFDQDSDASSLMPLLSLTFTIVLFL